MTFTVNWSSERGVRKGFTSGSIRKLLKKEGLSVSDSKAFIKRCLVRPGTSCSLNYQYHVPPFSVTAQVN